MVLTQVYKYPDLVRIREGEGSIMFLVKYRDLEVRCSARRVGVKWVRRALA